MNFCPTCDHRYSRKGFCTNPLCDLSYRRKKERTPLRAIFWRIVYIRPKGIYHFIINSFHRYHIVRTGLPKGCWIDTDTRLEASMFRLLVEFVEDEDALKYYYECSKDHSGINETNGLNDIMALYRDIKVTLPKLEVVAEEALDEWSKDSTMTTTPTDKAMHKVHFSYAVSEAIEHQRWNAMKDADKAVLAMRTSILERIVEHRHKMWT